MGLVGETGTVAVGALADLLVIDGDPSTDIGLLSDPAAFIPAVMKGGVFMKDQLEIA
jgi:imidazolonepropionase-like amidohydrolase